MCVGVFWCVVCLCGTSLCVVSLDAGEMLSLTVCLLLALGLVFVEMSHVLRNVMWVGSADLC